MQSSVSGEIRWRLTLYQKVLAHCQQGRFTLARFVALVPDRLRLSVGESIAKMRIPVAFPDSFLKEFNALMPPLGRLRLTGSPPWNDQQLRRVIRLAQIDSHLDPLTLGLWIVERGDHFIGALANLYVKALREVGQGEGGEETAYLVHLLLLRALRLILNEAQREARLQGQFALVCALASMALEAALSALGGQSLSARLGFQFAIAMSPPALGASDADLKYFLNSYRTSNEALELARRELSQPLEETSVEAATQRVTEALLKNSAVKTALTREALGEVIRDCLILGILRLDDRSADLLKALQKVATSGNVLFEHVHHGGTRDELVDCLDGTVGTKEPFKTLKRLLLESDRAMLGNSELLGRHGDLRQRAETAASGAIVYLFDDHIHRQLSPLLQRIELVTGEQQKSMYELGRCYQIDFSPRPFFLIPKQVSEAHLFVDVKDFTKRTLAIKERAMSDFLRRFFYQPIFEYAAKLKAGGEGLFVSNILGDAVAFHGDIRLMVPLALQIRRILSDAEQQLQQGLSDVLGGEDTMIAEIDAELARLGSERQRLAKQDENPSALKRVEGQIRMVQQAKEDRLARTVGLGLEAGAYISFGGAAETVDLKHPDLGDWSVTIAERLNEAARGTARSAKVKGELDRAIARARLSVNNPGLESPFRVHVGKSFQLDLMTQAAESLSSSLFSGDKTGITQSVKELARWLHQQASHAVDRGETNVPSMSRSAEFYNAGCAISGQALSAYEQATKTILLFQRLEVYRTKLPQRILTTFLLEHDPERFIVVTDNAGAKVHLLRYCGQTSFKGFEAQGDIEVWELLLPDSPFAIELHQSVPALHSKALA